MHSLEAEYQALADAGLISAEAAAQCIASERGAVFSLYEPLRLALYAAVLMIVAGVALLLRAHLDQIGPLALMAAVAAISALCYATAIRSRLRARPRSVAGDYLLLLGALLLSADLGYAETRFHWAGAHWSSELLLLTVWHAATAYAFESPLLLSTALASLVGWFGVQTELGQGFLMAASTGHPAAPALLCAGTLLSWRMLHRRLHANRSFDLLFAHFAANVGLPGAIACMLDPASRLPGMALLAAGAGLAIHAGRRDGQTWFVVYGIAYPAAGLCWLEAQVVRAPLPLELLELGTVLAALALLWRWRRPPRKEQP